MQRTFGGRSSSWSGDPGSGSAPRRAIVLAYHRLCAPSTETACYFRRGTAVEPRVFGRQLAWLARRFQFATLSEALAALASGAVGPDLCVLTFDDGYRDVLAASAAAGEHSAPLVVFPIAGHLADSLEAQYVDAYYALIHAATRRADIPLAALGLDGAGLAPGLDQTDWWLLGPVKEALHAESPARQRVRLARLAEVLECESDPGLPARLYLRVDDLRALQRGGHEIGGHGVRHRRLTKLDHDDLLGELEGSRALLEALGVRRPHLFAYPDGGHDERVVVAARTAGFTAACTIENGWCVVATPKLNLPRVLMPNALPTDPDWPPLLAE